MGMAVTVRKENSSDLSSDSLVILNAFDRIRNSCTHARLSSAYTGRMIR